jgi:hypothetical protein
MQALDKFISPVLGFNGDIPIPAIPVLARPPSNEPMSDNFVVASVSASFLKAQVGKQKVTANPTPQNKARKTKRRTVGRN